jgi:hypothetical protein
MLQALIQTAACAVLLEQNRLKGFHRKQAQTLHKLTGFKVLGFQHCAGLRLEGLLRVHQVMTEQAKSPKVNTMAVSNCWKQDVRTT